MDQLNLPKIVFKTRKNSDAKTEIFDIFRKKYVMLTPEEWVRQHVAHFLVNQLMVPSTLIAIEKKIIIHGLDKRFDIVVYSRKATPLLIVECKASSVSVSQAVFDQVARYNLALKSPYVMVTNGLVHMACKINFETSTIQYLNSLPLYSEMCLS